MAASFSRKSNFIATPGQWEWENSKDGTSDFCIPGKCDANVWKIKDSNPLQDVMKTSRVRS